MPEKISITVVTTGEDFDDEFNGNQPLRVVFNRALAAVGGQSNRDQFTLEYNDEPLDLDLRIAEAAERFGWGEEGVLELFPRPEVI